MDTPGLQLSLRQAGEQHIRGSGQTRSGPVLRHNPYSGEKVTLAQSDRCTRSRSRERITARHRVSRVGCAILMGIVSKRSLVVILLLECIREELDKRYRWNGNVHGSFNRWEYNPWKTKVLIISYTLFGCSLSCVSSSSQLPDVPNNQDTVRKPAVGRHRLTWQASEQ